MGSGQCFAPHGGPDCGGLANRPGPGSRVTTEVIPARRRFARFAEQPAAGVRVTSAGGVAGRLGVSVGGALIQLTV